MLGGIQLARKVLDKIEFRLREFVGLPDLVAELAVADDLLDVEVDAAALHHVGQQPETESVGSALWNTLSELMLQLFDGGVLLALGQVAIPDLADQALKGRSFDDLQRIDYISSRLRHLVSLGVADQGVQKDLLERDLASQPNRHHDHTSNPEEQNVMACLEQLVGEKSLEVEMLSIWPLQRGEGEES